MQGTAWYVSKQEKVVEEEMQMSSTAQNLDKG